MPQLATWMRRAGLAVVFLWFFVGGVGHFTSTPFFVAIVPPYVPFPLAAVYVSGLFEIVLALAILPPATRPWAGWLLIALTVAVTPANVHMWLHPEQFPDISETALGLRLVVQVLLLALIWWSTRVAPSAIRVRTVQPDGAGDRSPPVAGGGGP